MNLRTSPLNEIMLSYNQIIWCHHGTLFWCSYLLLDWLVNHVTGTYHRCWIFTNYFLLFIWFFFVFFHRNAWCYSIKKKSWSRQASFWCQNYRLYTHYCPDSCKLNEIVFWLSVWPTKYITLWTKHNCLNTHIMLDVCHYLNDLLYGTLTFI